MADEQKLLPGAGAGAQAESENMRLLSNTLAIIGFIIIAIVVIWGIYSLLKLANVPLPNWFATSPAIEVSAPQNSASGRPLTVSWKNTSNEGGSYAFLYQCMSNFSFATPGTTGVLNKVPCGTSINVGSSTAATMIPLVTGASTSSVPFTVVFTPDNGSAKLTGQATLAIAPSASQPAQPSTPSTPSTPSKPATSYHAAGNGPLVAHAASGPADLSVHIIASGYIDPGSGALLMNRPPSPQDIVGVEFDIANIGGSIASSYTFQAHLPTAGSYTYSSPAQMSLAPGQHVTSTLRFTQLAPGGLFTVVVNSADGNIGNNEAATSIY